MLGATGALVVVLAWTRVFCAAQLAPNVSTTASQLVATQASATVSPSAYCATFNRDCDRCFAEGCRFCEVGPQAWRPGLDANNAQGQFLDFTCTIFRCEELALYRPGTHHTRTIPVDQCASVRWPDDSTETTTATTTTINPIDDEANWVSLIASQEAAPELFFHSWGAAQWLAVTIPAAIILATCAFLWFRWKPHRLCRGKRSKVHVAPQSSDHGGKIVWDFSAVGPLSKTDIEAAEQAVLVAEEEEGETPKGRKIGQPAQRCFVLGRVNELRQPQLKRLGELLDRHPAVSLSLPADWRAADDGTLMALSSVLRRKARCRLQAGAKDDDGMLLLPRNANVEAIAAVAMSLSFGAHAEVDSLVFETPHTSTYAAGERFAVDLSSLRHSYQDLLLNRMQLGDLGCGAACAFVGSWAGRLRTVKLLECDVGDDGAAAVGRLLKGGPSDGGTAALRELTLSANRIGDKGVTAIADALSTCDSLERLLLDRNRIGPSGAKALALKLPRSNVKELVLGSHLGGNPLGPLGAEALAAALDDRLPRAAADRATRLTALALEDCNIQERGAKAFAAAMSKSDIQVLSMARGNLGDDGAKAILDALPAGLMSLDLAGNFLSNAIGIMVGDALRNAPRLAISLAQNELRPDVRDALSREHGARLRV